MREMNSMLNHQQQQQQQQSQMSLQDLQNVQSHFEPTSSHDDFLDQMLSTLPSCTWPDPSPNPNLNKSLPWELSNAMNHKSNDLSDDQYHNYDDQPAMLASKFRQHQISSGGVPAKTLLLQQQLLLSRGLSGGLRPPTGGAGAGDLLPMPLSLGNGDSFDRSQNDIVDLSAFKSPNPGADGSVQALYNGFAGSLHGSAQISNQSQHFHHPQAQNFGAPAPVMNQSPASGSGSGAPAQPRQRVRARRGQATDPHSIAERLRRERIAERMKALQELVPNANKTDKASMLDEIIDYVKFLQLQVKVLSMSRLGGAGAVAPLVADISSEGGGDCIQTSGGVGGRSSNGTQTASSSNDSMTVTEQQVAKLMEEDMGSAMQYLQGKGLCLMPISLATAISAVGGGRNHHHHNSLLPTNGDGGPTSPNMSVLTVQSATMGNGVNELSVKDVTSVSKP